MGNALCQPSNLQQNELLPSQDFDAAFKSFIKTLVQSTDNEKIKHVETFSLKWGIPLEGTASLLKDYEFSQVPVIPFEAFGKSAVVNIRICLTMDRFQENLKILTKSLQKIQEATPLMSELSASQDSLDQDIYYLMAQFFASSIINDRASLDLSRITDLVMKQRNGGRISFYYQEIESNEVLKDSIQSIKAILDRIKISASKINILWSYYILDMPAGTTNIANPVGPNSNSSDLFIGHISQLIPKKLLIFNPNAVKGTDGLTLYSGTICLRESLTEDPIKIIAQAQCLITILHEISHLKRVMFYSGGKFHLRTPDKLDFVVIKSEAGNFTERRLFGGVVNLDKLKEQQAETILNPENYSSMERLDRLKLTLRPCLINELQGSIARNNVHEDYADKCGMYALSYITAFEEN